MLGPLFKSSEALETIDDRLLRCGASRRAFLQFCSSLMIAAPFGLAITDKLTPEGSRCCGCHTPPSSAANCGGLHI
jgi:hydrogenase small subunit